MAEEDVIFGKLRHLYGGIGPSNMKVFKAEYVYTNGQNRAKITATLPDDTVIDNQTLCTVKGAMIRRKVGATPADEFDGELFMDIDSSGVFYDDNVEGDVTYTYAAFPYTAQGVYNRNPGNAATVTVLDGIPPEPLISFTATPAFVDGLPRVGLQLKHPGDTYIDGEKVNTFGGIIIRKSKTAYPINETDGILVKDLDWNNPDDIKFDVCDFTTTDLNVEINSTYYYSAFPYSTYGIYNRDESNRVSVTIDAGEPPANMSYFHATAGADLDKPIITIEADIPAAPVEGTNVSVLIRRKEGGYPTSESDGDLVTTFTATSPTNAAGHKVFVDKNLVDGTTYYYRAFPKTDRGAINTNDVDTNKITITAKAAWVMAFTIRNDWNNPAAMVSYGLFYSAQNSLNLQDLTITNASFTPAKMNFTTGEFEPGSWNFKPGEYFMPIPVCVTIGGSTDPFPLTEIELDPNDFTKSKDGVTVPVSSNSEWMMKWPKVYMGCKFNDKYENSYGEYVNEEQIFFFSNVPQPHTNLNLGLNPAFNGNREGWDGNSSTGSTVQTNDYMYTSIYPASKDGSRLRSIPGKHPYYTVSSDTLQSLSTLAHNTASSTTSNRDISWYQDRLYINLLLILMSRNLNAQDAFGYGSIAPSSQSVVDGNRTTGWGDKKGLFWGAAKSECANYTGVKVFGMEDFWGFLGDNVIGVALAYENEYESYPSAYRHAILHHYVANVTSWKMDAKEGDPEAYLFDRGNFRLTYLNYDIGPSPYKAVPTSQLGNGYLSSLHSQSAGGDTTLFAPCVANWPKPTDWVSHKDLDGSATTYYCDYVKITNYPSVPNTSQENSHLCGTIVYGHCGSDPTINSTSTIEQAGPYYINFSNFMAGTGVRLSYKKKQ